MNNWEKIIEGYSKKPDNQTMKLITATVTSVTNDFYRADVRLITGQEISNLINQTPNKLHVGQNVEVGYRTTPEAGWIQIAHGEPDPMRQGGGGVQVENAVLFDANDLHEYTTTSELMVDISANTKLYYGADNRIIVAQGVPCFLGAVTTSDFTAKLDDLLTANSAYIASEYSGLISYRYASGVVYKYETSIKVFPYQINTDGTRWRWWWTTRTTVKTTNMSTSAVTTNTYLRTHGNFYTTNFDDITDYGLLLITPNFGIGSPNVLLDSYIVNGYVGANTNIDTSSPSTGPQVAGLVVFKNSASGVDKWCANYQGTIYLTNQYDNGVGAYMPLTDAETCFALGSTQRSEPVTPGGGN